jgi:hypothetical protein
MISICAHGACEAARKKQPSDPRVHLAFGKYYLAKLGLARVAKAQKNSEEYHKHLKKALALDPEETEIQSEAKQARK